MRERKSRVSKAHDTTFRWIFDKNISGPWDSFNAWLKSEEQVYWISGKPGSGKSTLMKYLVDHDTTKELLQEWDPAVSILSFFLWNSGDKLQKSVQGLICALLSQILQPDEELICTLLAGDPGLLEKRTYNDWSDDELEVLLAKAIMTKEGPFSIIKLLETLEIKTNAKLCLSSRPEAEFQDALRKRRTLRLEDLTRDDIRASQVLGGRRRRKPSLAEREITDEILKRASGVFLWVFLVLRSLRSGTSNLDSYDQLLHRVRQLPSDLEQLYRQAWERHGEDEHIYRDQAASYFKLVLLSQQMMDNLSMNPCQHFPLSFLELLLAHDSHLRESLLDSHIIPPAKVLISKAHVLQRHIETRSGGLLEVFRSTDLTPGQIDMDDFLESCFENFLNQFLVPFSVFLDSGEGGSGALTSGKELAELWNISHALSVGFIHRTAADFVSNTDWGNKLMYRVQKSDQEIRTCLCEARLAHGLLYMFPYYQHRWGTSSPSVCDFLVLFDSIRSGISQEQYIRLRSSLERVYTQLIESSPKIDRLIDDLSTPILQGEFDSDYYKVMHDFIESGLINTFELIWGKDEKAPPSFSKTGFRVIQYLPSLADLSRQILANCRSGRPDPQAGCSSVSDLPLFPLPDTILSPSTSMPRISAHVVFSAWVLADSRDRLRHRTVQLLGRLSKAATWNGMSDCLQRYMHRWPHIYKTTKGFSKALMSLALSKGRDDQASVGSTWMGRNNCIRQLLSICEDPNWTPDTPRTTSSSPLLCISVPFSHFEWSAYGSPNLSGVWRAFPVPLRPLNRELPLPECGDQAVAYDFVVETDSILLLDQAKRVLKARGTKLQMKLEGLDDLPDTDRDFNTNVRGVILRRRRTRKVGALSGPERYEQPCFYPIKPEDMEIVAKRFEIERLRSPEDWIKGGSNFTMKTREVIASIVSKGDEVSNTWWKDKDSL
ncbi:hypothetical protein V8F33_001856 [Rhypophila sp. PSN 637]